MLAGVRSDLERYLVAWRSMESDSPELRSAQESLRTLNASLLWLQQYAGINPVVEVAQRLRMASLRVLRIIALLQHIPQATAPDTTERLHTPAASTTTTSLTV
jgi:hypothetical protein